MLSFVRLGQRRLCWPAGWAVGALLAWSTVVACTSAYAQGRLQAAGSKPVERTANPSVLPAAQVKIGMEGVCLTVLKQRRIEPLSFTVQGLVPKFLGPDIPLILIRLNSPRGEFTGVASGMSGSPCSVNGKLVGALSYALGTFSKQPIAGVTPYAHMQAVWAQKDEPRPWLLPTSADAQRMGVPAADGYARNYVRLLLSAVPKPAVRSKLGMRLLARQGWPLALRHVHPAAAPRSTDERTARKTGAAVFAGARLQPIATPISISGASEADLRVVADILGANHSADLAWQWISAGAVGKKSPAQRSAAAQKASRHQQAVRQRSEQQSDAQRSAKLQPGDAVAAVLARGAVDIAATGTVTSVDADGRVLAFGHPFTGIGAASIPMAQATVIQTMASLRRSYKLAAPGDVVGVFWQDRLTAIGGKLGDKPQWVPVQAKLRTPQGEQRLSLEIARDHLMTPRIAGSALAQALSQRVDNPGQGTLRVQVQLQMAQLAQPVRVARTFAAQRDTKLLAATGRFVSQLISAVWQTPFGAAPQLKVRVQAQVQPISKRLLIRGVRLDTHRARPGQRVAAHVRLQAEDGPEKTVHFTFVVPPGWQEQHLKVRAMGGGLLTLQRLQANGWAIPKNLQQVALQLEMVEDTGNLALVILREQPHLLLGSAALGDMPGRAQTMLAGTPHLSKASVTVAQEIIKDAQAVVLGTASAQLTVLAPRG